MIDDKIVKLRRQLIATPWYLYLPFIVLGLLIPAIGVIKSAFRSSVKEAYVSAIEYTHKEVPSVRKASGVYPLSLPGFNYNAISRGVTDDPVLVRIFEANPDVAAKVEGIEIQGVSHLFRYLQLIGAQKEEFRAMKCFYEQQTNKVDAAATIVDYINENYLGYIAQNVKKGNVGMAHKLVDDAYLRLSLLDTPPYGGISIEKTQIISKVLLLNMIFEHEDLVHYHPEELLYLYSVYIQNEKLQKVELGDSSLKYTGFAGLYNYWQGVLYFRDEAYARADSLFIEVEQETDNFYLKDLSILMQARSMYNADRVGRPIRKLIDLNRLVIVLDQLSRKIVKRSLRNDVEHYRDNAMQNRSNSTTTSLEPPSNSVAYSEPQPSTSTLVRQGVTRQQPPSSYGRYGSPIPSSTGEPSVRQEIERQVLLDILDIIAKELRKKEKQ